MVFIIIVINFCVITKIILIKKHLLESKVQQELFSIIG